MSGEVWPSMALLRAESLDDSITYWSRDANIAQTRQCARRLATAEEHRDARAAKAHTLKQTEGPRRQGVCCRTSKKNLA